MADAAVGGPRLTSLFCNNADLTGLIFLSGARYSLAGSSLRMGYLAVRSQGNPFSGPVCCEALYGCLSSQHGRLLRTWFIMESVFHVQASTKRGSSAISNIQSALGHYKEVHFYVPKVPRHQLHTRFPFQLTRKKLAHMGKRMAEQFLLSITLILHASHTPLPSHEQQKHHPPSFSGEVPTQDHP